MGGKSRKTGGVSKTLIKYIKEQSQKKETTNGDNDNDHNSKRYRSLFESDEGKED